MKWGVPISLAAGLIVAIGACKPIKIEPTGTFDREVRGGRFQHSSLPPFADANSVDVSSLFPPQSRELDEVLGKLRASDFSVTTRFDRPTPGGRTLSYVSMQQVVDGVPIVGTYLNFTLQPGHGDQPGRVLASSYHVFHEARVDANPEIHGSDAVARARQTLRVPATTPIVSSSLVIRPIHGVLRLVWDIGVQQQNERAMVMANGDDAGRVITVDDRVYETGSGTVSGYLSASGAPGSPNSVVESRGLGHLNVTAGSATTQTDDQGAFQIDANAGDTMTATLSGRAASVANQAGGNLSASAPLGTNTSLELGMAGGTGADIAQVTAYYGVESTLAYLLANGFSEEALAPALTTNVNIADTCNAYFSPAARTINFFAAGGSCYNSAERSIIAHEYGHFVDDTFGGIMNGGLSEGWGDTLACYLLDNPVVGGDLFTDGTIIRTCDNDYQYPASGSDEVHALGQAWAGFAWHAREGLIQAYGPDEGDAMARALVMPSLITNAPDIPAAVREVILRDDDDGDISNKTPHWDILYAAGQAHALGFVFEEDLIAPAAVTDLAASEVGATSVTLTWTATGDDGMDGTAAAYDLRYSLQPIDEGSFPAATQIPTAAPLPAGSAQQLTIGVPPELTLYLALKVRDEQGNTSGLSNVVMATTGSGQIVYQEGAEDGMGDWTSTGLWHVTSKRAAEGTQSFWYGQEATGNYDTGAANSGELVSGPISLAGAKNPVLVLSEFIDVEDLAAYDKLEITVTDVNDPTVQVAASKQTGSSGGVFQSRLLGLYGMEDRTVQIRFFFDTVDSVLNQTEGWYVDDIRIISDEPAPPEQNGVLLINEVLADPAPDYDANNDGTWSATQDEFIELLNVGTGDLDLSGATYNDAVRARYTFPEGTVLPPGGVLVLFGGGAPNIGDVPVLVTDGLYMNNTGDDLRFYRADGELLAEMSYGSAGGKDQSMVRATDADSGSPFVLHTTVSSMLASPGTRYDGVPFGPGRILINEVLADPPMDYDANGDGYREASEDEFVEIVNIGASPFDLSGATLSDDLMVRTTIPDGTILNPGQALVIFGGGTPAEIPGVIVLTSDTLMQLNNSGDSVTIADAGGEILDAMAFGTIGGQDSSLVRAADAHPDAPFVLHKIEYGTVASPGTRSAGSPF